METTKNTDECFEEISKVFLSALDKTCKLETPKTTKRNCINNPWITTEIIKSKNTLHQLPVNSILMPTVKCTLAEKLETTNNTDECFEEISKVFLSALDKTCKLETPKTTKRNCINNPWITTEIIKSKNTLHQLPVNSILMPTVKCTVAEKLETTKNTDECFEEISKVFLQPWTKLVNLKHPKQQNETV